MVGKKHEESFSHMNRHLSDRWIGAAVTTSRLSAVCLPARHLS